MVILLCHFVCMTGAMHVDWCSESWSRWNIRSLLTLFNENPDFISRFVTVDKTWLHHFDPESKAQSMAWKHVTSPPPKKFACSHQPAKSWRLYSWILNEFYWLTIWNMAELLQEPTTMLIWLENVERHWKRRDEESCDAVCCFIRTMHQVLLIHHHKHWLPSTHRIHQTWPPVASICFQNWKNSWKDGKMLTTMMLSAPRVTGWRTKIKNSSTMEYRLWRITGPSAFLLKGTMLKSDKISCTYSVVNCIRLWTFWMPLVCAYVTVCCAGLTCHVMVELNFLWMKECV